MNMQNKTDAKTSRGKRRKATFSCLFFYCLAEIIVLLQAADYSLVYRNHSLAYQTLVRLSFPTALFDPWSSPWLA